MRDELLDPRPTDDELVAEAALADGRTAVIYGYSGDLLRARARHLKVSPVSGQHRGIFVRHAAQDESGCLEWEHRDSLACASIECQECR